MGHALDNTLQDILIRWRRMQGYSALWLPGTDHASIATEAKIVGKMKEEGLTKEQIGREEFLKRAWDWKRGYGGRIVFGYIYALALFRFKRVHKALVRRDVQSAVVREYHHSGLCAGGLLDEFHRSVIHRNSRTAAPL